MIKVQIQKTTEYDKFKLFRSNRLVNQNHLKRLVRSVKAKNLMHLFPIVVNENFEVIDGQHRLATAVELGIPVYYLVDGSVTKADIAMVNNNRKGWAAIDFVNYYEQEGLDEFKKLRYIINTYGLPVIGASRLISKSADSFYSGGSQSDHIRNGKIDATDFELAKHICEIGKVLKAKSEHAQKSWFLMDIKNVIVRFKVDPKEALKKLQHRTPEFPLDLKQNSLDVRNILKEALVKESGHSKEEVAAILNKHL